MVLLRSRDKIVASRNLSSLWVSVNFSDEFPANKLWLGDELITKIVGCGKREGEKNVN